ncbi:hypothetical protein [Pseudothauera lacus]|uniref:Uncharacterized protein n=1 Tax=Pseudothauera lacus TaxID=2136175 RepID=A0A2T4IBS7_9RHOO|nr:hypothetical protein [Pseudothauera lacus]PTD95222.1 hypothetical protein C8261_15625 [Pseudothauera lacus]
MLAPPEPAALDAVKAWLAAEPDDDPEADLGALRTHYAVLRNPGVPAGEFRSCLALMDVRALDICERFRIRLLDASLPLPRALRVPAEALIDALLDLASGLERLVEEGRGRWARALHADIVPLARRALRLAAEAHLLASMIGAAAPAGFWLRVLALLGSSASVDADDEHHREVRGEAARIFALAVLQPESLTGRELLWVREFLELAQVAAEISHEAPEGDGAAFWLDPTRDAPPVATVRRAPPAVPELVHFSARGLALHAAARMEWLEERIAQAEVVGLERDAELLEPDTSGLPAGLPPVEALNLLRRMTQRWAEAPQREQPRLDKAYSVQVCAGLRAIWEMFRHGEERARIAQWAVRNESPGGYAIMSVSGVQGMLSAGMVLALRADAGKPWSICVVRWIRTESAEQVELGLQVVGTGGSSASVGFRGADTVKTMAPALILQPLEGVRTKPAIVVKTGSYSSRRFVLVDDADHLYVAQGRVISLDMQTANIEMFQYEIDPYPT